MLEETIAQIAQDRATGGIVMVHKNRPIMGTLFFAMLSTLLGCGSGPGGALALFPATHRLLKVTEQARDCVSLPAPVPRELQKTVIPEYIIEPGDVLLVETVAFDSPLRFPVDQTVLVDGTIDLGRFGRLHVAGMTVEQVETQLEQTIRTANMTYDEKPLTAEQSEINVRLMATNAAMYYVLGEVNSPGFYPLIGRETTLDAILTAGGLSDRASTRNIVIARASHSEECRTILPVCWDEIVQLGDSTTNYQIMPGDRIFVPTETCSEGMQKASRGECQRCKRCQCVTGSCPPSTPPPTTYALPSRSVGEASLQEDIAPIPAPSPEPATD